MTNRALLVGINDYPGQPLNGCVNDVRDMAEFLVDSCGFRSGDIRLLVDSRATTANIRERTEWLLRNAAPGDRLLFHYSGHGALFPIRNKDGEVTAVHDTICPVDFDWSLEHALLDDDLRKLFDVAPDGIEFVFISDSCNSGDLTRAFRRYRPRFFVPPADIAWRLRTAQERMLVTGAIPHDRCGLISGCRSDQESADAVFAGRPNGALTYYLLRALRAQSGLGTPLSPLVDSVKQPLARNQYDQEPQLRGPDYVKGRTFLQT